MIEFYSVGECPVCPGAGYVLALRAAETNQLVFYCPSCGTAWSEVPDPSRVDSVSQLTDLAPRGIRPLSTDEIHASGLSIKATLLLTEVSAELRNQLL
jgi:hypothetical protein